MTPFPITLALYTSTKGHFKKDTYRDTVNHILNQIPANYWGNLHANVKWEGNGDEDKRDEMASWLKSRGFKVTTPCKKWSHSDNSHSTAYLEDMELVSSFIKTPYLFHLEDDFLIHCAKNSLEYWLSESLQILQENTQIVQVRIARWRNEVDRINRLKEKHGIDGRAEWLNDERFRHNDWSNNPFIARTRDFHNAIRLVLNANLPKHSEHGPAIAMKLFSQEKMPFISFNPEMIRCLHQGTLANEQDTPETKLIAD